MGKFDAVKQEMDNFYVNYHLFENDHEWSKIVAVCSLIKAAIPQFNLSIKEIPPAEIDVRINKILGPIKRAANFIHDYGVMSLEMPQNIIEKMGEIYYCRKIAVRFIGEAKVCFVTVGIRLLDTYPFFNVVTVDHRHGWSMLPDAVYEVA